MGTSGAMTSMTFVPELALLITGLPLHPVLPMPVLATTLGHLLFPFSPLHFTQSVCWRGDLKAPVLFLHLEWGIISTLSFS